MSSTTASEEPLIEHEPGIAASIDRLSLEQALRDTEVATARVIDLTARLTTVNEELLELRGRLAAMETGRATSSQGGGLRALVAPPIKAVARRVLPLGVRTRIRLMLT